MASRSETLELKAKLIQCLDDRLPGFSATKDGRKVIKASFSFDCKGFLAYNANRGLFNLLEIEGGTISFNDKDKWNSDLKIERLDAEMEELYGSPFRISVGLSFQMDW